MADSSTYRFFPDDVLANLIAAYLDGINAVNETGQSYSANGVSFTRANLTERETSLGLMYAEQAKRTGQAINRAYPIVRRRYGGRTGPGWSW